MCWLAQGEVFDFALGEFRSIPTRLNLNINRKINIKQSCFVLCYTDLMRAISGTMALTSSGL